MNSFYLVRRAATVRVDLHNPCQEIREEDSRLFLAKGYPDHLSLVPHLEQDPAIPGSPTVPGIYPLPLELLKHLKWFCSKCSSTNATFSIKENQWLCPDHSNN